MKNEEMNQPQFRSICQIYYLERMKLDVKQELLFLTNISLNVFLWISCTVDFFFNVIILQMEFVACNI